MGATFKGDGHEGGRSRCPQLPRGEPLLQERKGRGRQAPPPPHVPMVHGPQRPRQDRRPIGNISRRHRTPHAARRTPHAPVGHVRDLLLLLLPSGHDALFLVAHCGWSVGWSFGFCLLGVCLVVFVRSSLLGIKFLRFVAHCQSISQGRPHDFGRPGGAGGEGGGYAPHHAASKEYVYVPSVRTLRYTYIPTYH